MSASQTLVLLQDKAIQALTAALAPKAKVLRDGKFQTIEAADLVPGDVVIVKIGDIPPADVKVIGTSDEYDQPLQVKIFLWNDFFCWMSSEG